MQTVVEHITSYCIAETIEEVGTYGNGGHVEPSLVVYQVGKLVEGELLCSLRLQPLLGKKTASQGHHGCNDTQDGTDNGILMGSSTAHHLLKIWEREQCGESHRIGTHHTEGRELVFLVIILGHHTEQGTIRYIHHRIYRHHQKIEDIGIDTLAHRTEIRRIEQERENQSERNGSINQPGTIGTEATLCTVGKTTHQRVGHHIKHTSHQHQHGSIGKRESEDIGKKQRESDRHHLPNDTTGSGIAQSISNFFL